MTKKPLPIIAALLLTMTAHAQTADEHHSLTLGDGQTWTVPDATKLYAEETKALCEDYSDQITSSALYRAMGGDEHIQDFRMQYCMEKFVQNTLKGEALNPVWWAVGELEHGLIQNKRFRDFLSGRINDLLVEMCELYPSFTKQKIISLLDDIIALVDRMGQHSYKIVKVTHHGSNGSTWVEDALQKDNRILELDKMTQKEIDWVFGLEGRIIRRVLYDGMSLSEIKGYLQSARKAVADTDVSKKAAYAVCYTINQQIKVWVAMHGNICRFNSGKTVDNATSITYLEDLSGAYYKIVGPYQWVPNGRFLIERANSILYDSQGSKIYEETVTK